MVAVAQSAEAADAPLSFMWLEITGRCDLRCVHCYADSGPQGTPDTLGTARWIRLLDQASALGVEGVQFIGGEPTIHPGLPQLIRTHPSQRAGPVGRANGETRSRRCALLLTVVVLCVSLSVLVPSAARAWKPNTHIYTGEATLTDVLDGDKGVTIARHEYEAPSLVVEDLRKWPSYYQGGVVGPDGFPDIAYGQGIIHPKHTGRWLRYIFDEAWAAQSDASYSEEEKQQILAFAYGFLTHAAGDMWGHTLINTFAGGVFPDFTMVLSNLEAAKIAVRHLVVEQYIGSATPGYDSMDSEGSITSAGCSPRNEAPPDTVCNVGAPDQYRIEPSRVCAAPNSPPTPGTNCWVTGSFGSREPDVSSDAMPGAQLDAPLRFIQRTMVDLRARTPADQCGGGEGGSATDAGCPDGAYTGSSPLQRGAALDFVLREEAKLQIKAAEENERAKHNCLISVPFTDCHTEGITLTVPTVIGTAQVGVTHYECTTVCIDDPTIELPAVIIRDYAGAWVHDIDELRSHWADFALGVARGLFDPQARRDAANDSCKNSGPDTIDNTTRRTCEDAVGHVDAVIYELDHFYSSGEPSFINRYLIPASGSPDIIASGRSLLAKIASAISGFFQFLGIPNPIEAIEDKIHEFITDKVDDLIKEQYGIDPEALDQFIHNPAQWMCGADESNPASLTLPGLGTLTPGGIYTHEDHGLVDSLMALPSEHHEPSEGLPVDCSPLKDETTFDPNKFAPIRNTITTAKLLLLDGKELDRAMGTILVDQGIIKNASSVKTYSDAAGGPPANIMIDGLNAENRASPATTWLDLIDGDHAWRANRLPDYCKAEEGSSGHCEFHPCKQQPTIGRCEFSPLGSGEEEVTDKTFEHYATKPRVQNTLDTERRGGNGNFPPWASCLLRPAFRAVDQSGSPVGLYADWQNSANPVKNFPNLGDPPAPDASVSAPPTRTLTVTGPQYTAPAGTQFLGEGVSFTFSAHDEVFTDGALSLSYSLSGPGFSDTTHALANGGSFGFPLGAQDGLWTITTNAASPCVGHEDTRSYVRDTTPPVTTVTQPLATTYTHSQTLTLSYQVSDGTGSGVKSFTPTLDGSPTLAGHGLQSGQAINLLTELSLGPHTFKVDAVDNVNNQSSTSVTFVVVVSPQSIKEDVLAFFAAGEIKNAGTENSLLAKLAAAFARRQAGNCKSAGNIYRAFQNELAAQGRKHVSATAASIMSSDAQYLIDHCP